MSKHLLQSSQGTMLCHTHSDLALSRDGCDLVDVQLPEYAKQDDLGLVWRKVSHEQLNCTLSSQTFYRHILELNMFMTNVGQWHSRHAP